MSETAPMPDLSGLPWIVVTPSVDEDGWRRAIVSAADELGWAVVSEHDLPAVGDNRPRLVLTDDAERALLNGAVQIAAIVSEPETAPEAIAERHDIHPPATNLHASLLLARALALSPHHRVVTPVELAERAQTIVLFDRLRVTPPASRAEVSRTPAVSAAFKLYRATPAELLKQPDPINWSEKLFTYDPRASRDWPTWGVLDTTGRPRILVFGPYLSMPPGNWRACMRFAVDADAAKRQYRLDWGTRTACVSEYVTPGAPGIYELELDFVWTGVDVAEIRLILIEGSFMGTLMFQGMTVRKIADPPATAQAA